MKVLMVTRLMSGFTSSIESANWKPEGAPAIYRIMNHLDRDKELNIIFTLKAFESIDEKYINRKLSINGLSTQPIIFPGPAFFPKILGSFRTYLSELCQSWRVYRYIKKSKPDLLYIDRANVLLGAIIARFTSVPVYLRLLGAPPSLEVLLTRSALSHYLYRWAYRSSFRMVLCSIDGSPGKDWMRRALDFKVPRKSWVNGVDLISSVRQPSSVIRIVLIGRLNYLKRIDQAVEAILRLPKESLDQICVDIIGDGELYPAIKHRIQSSFYAERFILHGAIPHEVVLKRLSQSDILISLNTHGNLTNTVLEGIRCGLCLILPKANSKSGIDVDTYSFLSEELAIQLRQENLLEDLAFQLQRLIKQPALIRQYQEKVQKFSKNLDTWGQRINREVQLLKPYDMAIVISDLRGGGTQKVLERLLKHWVLQGKRIVIITFDKADNDSIQLPDVVDRIELGGAGESKNFLTRVVENFRRLYRIRCVIRGLNPPLVFSFLSTTNILAVLATRGLSCRLIISERNDPVRQSFGFVWDYLRKKCYRHADVVTANSHSAIQAMTEFVDKKRCYYVPNPVVLPENISPAVLEKPTILAVGRLHVQKAYDVLIQAFGLFYQKHPDWQLIILGEGGLRPQLESQIRRLQMESVIQLKGYADPFPYFSAAQIYTMPSRYEGMPNALLEAMAMAMPVVVTDALKGPLDFIQDGKNALVVPVDDSESLSIAFSKLADQPNLRQILSDQAKNLIASFSLESVLSQWELLLEQKEGL